MRLGSVSLITLFVALLLLIACHESSGLTEEEDQEWPKEERREWPPEKEEETGFGFEPFLLKDSKQVVKTDAGEMRIVKSLGGKFMDGPLRIGFIMMEPKTLFVPQYLDSDLILFVPTGEVKLGYIYKDELAERRLKMGDVYRIPAGSAFYLVNVAEGQRLHIICSFDTAQGLSFGTFKSFFVGGGVNSASILSGFDSQILENAFNVTYAEIKELLTSQHYGPIVHIADSRAPRVWSKFLELKEDQKLQEMKRIVGLEEDEKEEAEEKISSDSWFWRKLMAKMGFIEKRDKRSSEDRREKGKGKSPDSYNIYDAKKGRYQNSYGWSIAVDGHDFPSLRKPDIGVYYVNLSAGSMMAPHVNPRATEYGIVLKGSGTIQIVYPNGTLAMNSFVKPGAVFWVPRFFPFCQVASRAGPFEFVGFTTSARNNHPQFLAGYSSLFRALRGPELALSLGLTEDRLRDITEAQSQSVILPSASAAPPHEPDVSPVFLRTVA